MTLPLALSERAAAYFRDGFRSESGHHNLIPLRQLMTHTGQAYDTARLTIGEAVRSTLLNGQSAESCGLEDDSLLVRVIGDADKVIPPDILLKFATRAKSKIYHVPGGDHPSMIAHPEVTVAAIEDAANAVSH